MSLGRLWIAAVSYCGAGLFGTMLWVGLNPSASLMAELKSNYGDLAQLARAGGVVGSGAGVVTFILSGNQVLKHKPRDF